jgi:uncharacterized membrane protein YkvA (DUF1232 family)
MEVPPSVDPATAAKVAILLIITLMYVVSPLDLIPGMPIDDIALTVLNSALSVKAIKKHNN